MGAKETVQAKSILTVKRRVGREKRQKMEKRQTMAKFHTSGKTLTLPKRRVFTNSPRPSTRLSVKAIGLWKKVQASIVIVEKTLITTLEVPKVRPIDVLGPSREFYEKHGLTFINNLMGLSCLFFLSTVFVVTMEFSTLIEQNRASLCWAFFVSLWCTIQSVLSFCGDYWLCRISPENGSYVDQVFRWLQGKRQVIVVTTPHRVETWKRWWVATTLDVLSAHAACTFILACFLWQLWNGANKTLVASWFVCAAIAGACKVMGGRQWKGQDYTTYDPKKIWWFNFLHFGWHLFLNIACYTFTYDLCHNGLRGIQW